MQKDFENQKVYPNRSGYKHEKWNQIVNSWVGGWGIEMISV